MRAILLVDHGSRAPAANESLGKIAGLVAERAGEATLIGIAHMELAAPSIAEGVAALTARGATQLVVMPYFLAAGRHSTEDIPRLVAEAMRAHPNLPFRVSAPLGIDPLLATLVLQRAEEA